jgi:serine/threonine-protein kinase
MKRLRPPVVAQIITQIARALGRAHEAGLIHRDLKPDNILIVRNDDEEIVKVLDFGIAKWMSGPANLAGGTLQGQMLGTPAYMSPEHFANSSHIDHRADLWSLGVIAFECLVGMRPFQGDSLVSLALNVCSGKYPMASSLAEVPEGFDVWFARAVSQDPNRRFASARLMAEELRGLCGQQPMLWESEAAPPEQHTTREKTELEPVLELTRRARSSRVPPPPEARRPITEVDSVLTMLRTPPPGKRGSWRWAFMCALFLGFGATTIMATPGLRPASVDRLVTRVRDAALSLRRSPELPVAPFAAAPPVQTPPPAPARSDIVSSLKKERDAGAGADAGPPRVDSGVGF